MLQQTQVATVIDYWHRWMAAFPTVEALAAVDEESVLGLWQGLGYYRRCRMLLAGARYLVEQGLPTTAAEWEKVPGIGRYTAGAISSIAQGVPAPLVDGNVERVYARLEGDEANGPALTKNAWRWAEINVNREAPGDWNQALMELGATLCTPVAPQCGRCPLSPSCIALKSDRVGELPRPTPKPATVELLHRTYILRCGERFGVRRIPEGQWWHGMFEFPREECPAPHSELRKLPAQKIGSVKHTVTHHRITLEVFSGEIEEPIPNLEWKNAQELEVIPMPSPQRKALALWHKKRLQKDLNLS